MLYQVPVVTLAGILTGTQHNFGFMCLCYTFTVCGNESCNKTKISVYVRLTLTQGVGESKNISLIVAKQKAKSFFQFACDQCKYTLTAAIIQHGI